MRAKKPRPQDIDEATLAFDVTQDIDPSFVDEALRQTEPTLTQHDFEDDTVVLPPKPKR